MNILTIANDGHYDLAFGRCLVHCEQVPQAKNCDIDPLIDRAPAQRTNPVVEVEPFLMTGSWKNKATGGNEKGRGQEGMIISLRQAFGRKRLSPLTIPSPFPAKQVVPTAQPHSCRGNSGSRE